MRLSKQDSGELSPKTNYRSNLNVMNIVEEIPHDY